MTMSEQTERYAGRVALDDELARLMQIDEAVRNYLSVVHEAEQYDGDDDYHMLHLEGAVQWWRDELWRLTDDR
jgi:hypothetical protein